MTDVALSDLGWTPGSVVTSVYLWGDDRPKVNAAARLLAGRLDPRFRWVEAGEEIDSEADLPTPTGSGPLVCSPRELVPRRGIRPEAVWRVLRPNGQRAAGLELLQFLRLPDPLQVAVSALLGQEGPRVLVVANIDRIEPFDRAHRGMFGQFLELLNRREITLIATTTGRPLLERIEFQYSVTIPTSLPRSVGATAAICQWGDCDSCFVQRFFSDNELVCISRLAMRARAVESLRAPDVPSSVG